MSKLIISQRYYYLFLQKVADSVKDFITLYYVCMYAYIKITKLIIH